MTPIHGASLGKFLGEKHLPGVGIAQVHCAPDPTFDFSGLRSRLRVYSWLAEGDMDAGHPPVSEVVLESLHAAWDMALFLDLPAIVLRHPTWQGISSPSQSSLWHHDRQEWFDTLSTQDHQTTKWAEIKQARESAINAPLQTSHGDFDANAKARASITDAVLMLQTLSAQGTPQNIDWTLANNTVVTLTTAQMVEVGVLLGQQVQAAYTQARSLRLQIEAATTAQEVGLVVWV